MRAAAAAALALLAAGCGGSPAHGPSAPVRFEGEIAYRCERHGADQICTVNADGSDPRILTAGPSILDDPRWSPDGKILAFTREAASTSVYASLFILDPAGPTVSPLTTPSSGDVTWSPDGRRIADSLIGDGEFTEGIFTVDLRSRARKVVVPGDASGAAWSPDGLRIAFVSNGFRDVYVAASAGGDVKRLTNTPQVPEEGPSWSPDGRRIAYYAFPAAGLELWVMDADGSHKRRLVSEGDVSDRRLSYGWPIVWSPDGTELAYTGEALGSYHVLVVGVESGRRRELVPGFEDASGPTWSPDGRAIAFMSNHDSRQLEIWVVGVDGAGLRRLTRNETTDASPTWRPVEEKA